MRKINIGDKIKKSGIIFNILDVKKGYYLAHLSSSAYEIGKIRHQKQSEAKIEGKTIKFEEKEYIPSDEQFGTQPHEACSTNKQYILSKWKNI